MASNHGIEAAKGFQEKYGWHVPDAISYVSLLKMMSGEHKKAESEFLVRRANGHENDTGSIGLGFVALLRLAPPSLDKIVQERLTANYLMPFEAPRIIAIDEHSPPDGAGNTKTFALEAPLGTFSIDTTAEGVCFGARAFMKDGEISNAGPTARFSTDRLLAIVGNSGECWIAPTNTTALSIHSPK